MELEKETTTIAHIDSLTERNDVSLIIDGLSLRLFVLDHLQMEKR